MALNGSCPNAKPPPSSNRASPRPWRLALFISIPLVIFWALGTLLFYKVFIGRLWGYGELGGIHVIQSTEKVAIFIREDFDARHTAWIEAGEGYGWTGRRRVFILDDAGLKEYSVKNEAALQAIAPLDWTAGNYITSDDEEELRRAGWETVVKTWKTDPISFEWSGKRYEIAFRYSREMIQINLTAGDDPARVLMVIKRGPLTMAQYEQAMREYEENVWNNREYKSTCLVRNPRPLPEKKSGYHGTSRITARFIQCLKIMFTPISNLSEIKNDPRKQEQYESGWSSEPAHGSGVSSRKRPDTALGTTPSSIITSGTMRPTA